MTSNLARFI